MSTLYVTTKDDKRPNAATPESNYDLWALAGDGRGGAAWLETRDNGLANDWSLVHGRHVWVLKATFNDFRNSYINPEPVVVVP